jgi:hypothetical protein
MWAKYNLHFILAFDREELRVFDQSALAGAIYSPGSTCACCSAVGQVQAVIQKCEDRYVLVCDNCAITYWAINVHPWRWVMTAYDSLPPILHARYAELEHAQNIAGQTKPQPQHYAQIGSPAAASPLDFEQVPELVVNRTIDIAQTFGWIRYTERSPQVLETLLDLVSGNSLSLTKKAAAERLIEARGGMTGIKRRRDLQYRIQRLQRVPELRFFETKRLKRLSAANLNYARYSQGWLSADVDKIVSLEKRYKDSLRRLDEQALLEMVIRSRLDSPSSD